jgi:hypothetical protein
MKRQLTPVNTEPNCIELLSKFVEINSEVSFTNGINHFIRVKISKFNLEDLLTQLIDDYGAEKLIEKINQLEK